MFPSWRDESEHLIADDETYRIAGGFHGRRLRPQIDPEDSFFIGVSPGVDEPDQLAVTWRYDELVRSHEEIHLGGVVHRRTSLPRSSGIGHFKHFYFDEKSFVIGIVDEDVDPRRFTRQEVDDVAAQLHGGRRRRRDQRKGSGT